MSEITREVIKEYGKYRIVKITYDFATDVFIIEQNYLNAMEGISWVKVGQVTSESEPWIYNLLSL